MPTFSICILAHNNAAYLPDALASVKAQTFSDWECVISDDASTDNTHEILAPWLEDARFRYIPHEQNLGQAGNWAAALREARGDCLTTLHADDVLEPTALESYLGGFRKNHDLVWANWGYFDETAQNCFRTAPVTDRELDGRDVLRWIVRNNHTLPSATAFTRDLVQRAGLPDDRCGIFCDRDYFLRLAAQAHSGEAIGRMLVRYRQHTQSVTTDSTFSGRLQQDMIKLGATAGTRFSGCPDDRTMAGILRRQCGETVLTSAWDMVLQGKSGKGFHWLAEACRLSGWSLLHPSVLISLARTTKSRLLKILKP